MKEAISWVVANWVAISAIVLGIVRLLESIAKVLPTKPQGILNMVIAVIKEIFRFG